MANTSRKKTLPLAVLAAPALAFGSLTFAAAPAMAVPVDEVEQILNEVDTILVYATEDTPVYRDGEESGTYSEGSLLRVDNYDPENAQFIGYSEEERYDMAAFEHATADQYREEDLEVPTFIAELENDDVAPQLSVADEAVVGAEVTVELLGFTADSDVVITLDDEEVGTVTVDAAGEVTSSVEIPADLEPGGHELIATGSVEGEVATSTLTIDAVEQDILAEITVSASEASVGDTVRLTLDNADELVANYFPEAEGAEIELQGDFRTAEGIAGRFGSEGINPVQDADAPYTYEFTIPESVNVDSETRPVEPGSDFTFFAAITVGNETEEYIASGTYLNIIEDDEEETPVDEETPAEPELVEPALSVESDEILVEDFVGDPEEGAGVVHNLTGMAPDTEFEYSVETPANIQPFSSSVFSDENGAAEFSIYGENADNPSVYAGDYTTTVTYEDEEGETQTLSVSFSVVEASDDNGDVGGEEDNEVTPVVDTEEPAEPVADTDNDQDEAAPAPAVGGADAQLADTGANGTSLMWIAGGLLALGGAFVIYANRGRLFGRKN